jgi:hypothetical protein
MPNSIDDLLVGTGDLARVLGLTRQRVSQLTQERVISKAARGKYALGQPVRAYTAYLTAQPWDGSEAGGAYGLERTRYLKIRNDLAESIWRRSAARAFRSRTPFSLGEACAVIRSKLIGLPSKVTPRLVGEAAATVFAVLTAEVRSILEELVADAEMRARAAALSTDTGAPPEGAA